MSSGVVRLCLPLFVAALLGISQAHAQSDATDCSMERMELDPRSVIAPCSERLLRSDLSPQQRGMALFVRGRGYHRTGQFALAGSDYDQALEVITTDDDLWVSRANVYFRLDQPAEGFLALEKAYQLNQNNPRFYFMIGYKVWQSGQPEKALELFSRALAIDPNEPYSLQMRAQIAFDLRQFPDAFRDIGTLIGIKPEVINRLGYLDNEGRMRDFHIVALAQRGTMFQDMAQYERAEQDFDAAVAYKRSAESLTARGGFLLYRPGRIEAALADVEEATSLDNGFLGAFNTKGVVLARLNRFDEAFAAFDRAVTIAPKNDYALKMRGKMHQALGRPEAAAEDVAAAAMLNPRVLRQTAAALNLAGYWKSPQPPVMLTREFRDALLACMIDPTCN